MRINIIVKIKMEANNRINEGEWLCTIEGLAIAEKVYDFYFEEYDSIPQDKKIGDYNFSMVQYRLFCDYDGHPVIRNRCRISNASYCSPICAKYEKVLKRSIKDNPKEYASFVKFLKTPQEKRSWITVAYAISNSLYNETIHDLNKIQETLPPKFTFPELLKNAADNQCVINMTDFVESTYDIPLWVRINLSYNYGDYSGKRVLFDRFSYEVGGKEVSNEPNII